MMKQTFHLILQRIKDEWSHLSNLHKAYKDTDPKAIMALAGELRELAGVAERLGHSEDLVQLKIKSIQTELRQLDCLLHKPTFKRMSPKKRLHLRESLMQSKKLLIETVQSAPSPTSTLQ